VSGLSVFLSERAIKRKRPTRLTRRLPSVSDGEQLQINLLTASAIVLGCGLLSGMATQLAETGQLLVFAHKTAFSLLTFVILVALVVAHHKTGLRGRQAARLLLIAYLFLTLAYPGVKFVTDVILAA
jgi:ABC-type uncharacterized transport system permease subunit